jgi:hypothetical protein
MSGFHMMRVSDGHLHMAPHAQIDGATHAYDSHRAEDQDEE